MRDKTLFVRSQKVTGREITDALKSVVMRRRQLNLLVFLPCFNEGKTLATVIGRIPKTIEGIASIDILVVDDGSLDNSAQEARKAGAHVIAHIVNRGVGATFQTALNYAIDKHYDCMVNIDADGQFDPVDIPRLLQPILDGKADFVSGSRFKESGPIENMSKVKHWGNQRITSLINRLIGGRFTDVSCGFRAYSRESLMHLNLYGDFTYTQESFMDLAFQRVRIAEVPIGVTYFADRQSRVAGSISKYAGNTALIIFRTYRDYHPLRFFGVPAAISFFVGVCFFSFLAVWWFRSGAFSPHIWSGFVGGAFCLFGLLVFTIALIADMFVRIRINQEKMLYLLKRRKGLQD